MEKKSSDFLFIEKTSAFEGKHPKQQVWGASMCTNRKMKPARRQLKGVLAEHEQELAAARGKRK
jgi:hypothetical protein